MKPAAGTIWQDANQGALSAALAVVRAHLKRHAAPSKGEVALQEAAAQLEAAQQSCAELLRAMPSPPAWRALCKLFGLSPFECDIVLLCAGMELESSFVSACVEAHGDPQRPYPTLSLALAALPDAHWSALRPEAPLRRWRLVEFASPAGAAGSIVSAPLTTRPIRIDERVLHYLTGVHHVDERLACLLEPVRRNETLAPTHQEIAGRVVGVWKRAPGEGMIPVIGLYGADAESARAIAAQACAAMGLNLQSVPARLLSPAQIDLQTFVRLWEREAALSASALLIECDDEELSEACRESAIDYLIEKTGGAILIAGREHRRCRHRAMANFEVHRPSAAEQRNIWQIALGPMAAQLDGDLNTLVSQFKLSASAIQAAATEAAIRLETDSTHAAPHGSAETGPIDDSRRTFESLWDECRNQTRTRLDSLAQHIEPAAEWDDLVLPEAQKEILQDIVAHVRHRAKVYETWGFAKKGSRGLGVSAMFAGASGTGKTMAAETLAKKLRLDLYRIDLSSVVSKYIGETEKNLRRVFDAAESGGAILLFDEADALFGKRSEVKDSHDRYANIEVSYLLQRMECYRGLAILTTNLRSALDTAFLRRIRFVVQFPFPDVAQRAEIWRRIFPSETPTEGIAAERLAQLNVAGGNIRNIALNAAFLAADAGEPVRMRYLLLSAQSEYVKLEKSLAEAEVAGWA